MRIALGRFQDISIMTAIEALTHLYIVDSECLSYRVKLLSGWNRDEHRTRLEQFAAQAGHVHRSGETEQ